jgi:DNA-binding transcriptional LysR family regulator
MAIDVLTGMRVFTAVVEAGSFAAAADKLDLSRGMATRYVAQIEAHLGVRLLNRTTRRLSLTEAGSDYYQRATQVLALVDEAESFAAQKASVPRGTLRVNAPVVFGARHLGRAIGAYLRRYPEVKVDLALSDRVVDLVEEGCDLAVRIATRVDPGLVARPLTRARTVACAAPGYLKAHGVPRAPEDLARHNCLTYSYAMFQYDWRFRRRGRDIAVKVSGNLHGNHGETLCNAALDGLGVILQPTFLVHDAMRAKKLVRVLPEWETDEFTVYAVYPHRKYLPPKVRSFVDFLVERFGPEPYWDKDIRD